MNFSSKIDKDLAIFKIVLGFILTVVVFFNYLVFKNVEFILFQGFIVFIIFVSVRLLTKMINKHLNESAKEIVSCIDGMQNGKLVRKCDTAEEDTIFGVIQNNLFQLYDSISHQKMLISQNKEILQSAISDVSHQLRTPLTSIKLSVDYLMVHNESIDEKIYLDVLDFETKKIATLTDYLVNSSRLEIGIIQLDKIYVNFYEILIDIIQSLLVHSKKLNQDIFFDCKKDMYFSFDPKWTKEAISNIIENAIKYTPDDGKISIVVSQNINETIIQIKDTGIGISEENFGLIFKRFGRVSKNNTDGLGIGLYLANKIIKLQGGYIIVKSELGNGSIFEIHMKNK